MIRFIQESRSWLPTFAGAAMRYWAEVFPAVRRETRRWVAHANDIPDPSLRHLALRALTREHGNLEGAAAFAAFTPPRQRRRVVGALVAFQAIYDYVDSLSELPSGQPIANAYVLHRALLGALGDDRATAGYYRHNVHTRDGGYLEALVRRCKDALTALPSYPAVAALTRAAAVRMAIYQSLNLCDYQGSRAALERWGCAVTPPRSGLHWWETAAAYGSSLPVFAQIAAAASPCLNRSRPLLLTAAYLPWIGALHILLDSLVDHPEDVQSGRGSLMECYDSPTYAALRLRYIAVQAARRAGGLPDGPHHSLIVAAMTSFYLSEAPIGSPYAHAARRAVLAAMGDLAAPTMLVMLARRHLTSPAERRAGRPVRRRSV